MKMQTQQLMTPTAPTPQWRDALNKGNAVRTRRANYKRDMRAGKKTSADLLLSPPDCALDVKVVDVLQWIPGIKRKRALNVLSGIVYSESMTLRRLSSTTRRKLYNRVEHYRPTYADMHGGV